MASLSSTGLGSGLDIEGLVTKLMEIERAPITQLAKKEAAFQSKITAYGSLKGALSTFQTAVNKLSTPSAFNTQKASVADTTIATASAASNANIGSYTLEVESLAQAHKLRTSSTYATTTSTVGSGTMSIDFGSYSGGGFALNGDKSAKTITISAAQNTLSGVRDAINTANAGITATIVNDGGGYRLLLTSNDTGLENQLRIQTSGSLSGLAYDASGTYPSSMTESQVAKDAEFTLDGISMTRASNTITDALDGVTLTLAKTNVGSSTVLSVIRDSSSIATSIQGFVTAYNTLKTTLTTLTGYNAETKVAGTLQGDATALSIQAQLRGVFNTILPFASGGYTSLTDAGISFKKDGTLTLDTAKLTASLNDYTKDIASLFTTVGNASDSLIKYSSSTTATKPGNYAVNVTQLATRSSLTGVAATGSLTITAGVNNAIAMSVDGTALSITLAAGSYTNATLAAELQSKINSALSDKGSSVSVTAATAASSTGNINLSTLTYPFSPTTGNDSLQVTIGGVLQTISLAGQTFADATALATGLQTAINAAFGANASTVSVESGNLLRVSGSFGQAGNVSIAVDGTSTLFADIFGTTTQAAGTEIAITSQGYGAGSSVTLTASTAVTNLFGSATTGSTAVNAGGTIGGVVATGFGRTLTAPSGDAAGLKIEVLGGALGARGTLSIDSGFAVRLDQAISSTISTSGSIATRTVGLNGSITALADRGEVLARRLTVIEARYRAQFNALDSMIASMQQTSTFLEQQLSTLNNSKK
ncbi:MAG: flagellar filament capping protein FliD [Rhodocyclaceae bacterium]|nr:flagellar filament capping protein FliD [Rhodocyclaceae bacterium]